MAETFLPAPFDWIDISAGHVILEDGKGAVNIPAFAISKYPITNSQFAKFIEVGGYQNRKWWTELGWTAREKNPQYHYDQGWHSAEQPWTEPYFWESEYYGEADQPVVGVSWYEAVAFCLWLSDVTGERIMLPTADQWQRAAQGDDGRIYPWGNIWDSNRCNHRVDRQAFHKATPVTQYEGTDDKPLGQSPFGVVDMVGNVSEWCLTDYDKNTNDVNANSDKGIWADLSSYRVLRGQGWMGNDPTWFRCAYRGKQQPANRQFFSLGFRISRA